MASVSVSTLVIFIASLAIAAGVSAAMIDSVSRISDSIDDRGLDVEDQIDTDIEIVSDAGSGAISRDADTDGTRETVLLVKNVGQGRLPASADHMDVLVDGQYVAPSEVDVTVMDGSEWGEGNVVQVVVDRELATGRSHRVALIVNDEQETLEFYVDGA